MPTLKLQTNDLSCVCDFVMESCGIYLDESKDYLIESRLSDMCHEFGLDSYTDLIAKARSQSAVANRIVDAMTTNETLFFRDESPFFALQHKAVPELIDSKEGTPHSRRIRIWSSACSTGQEVYSIAMTMCELIPDIDAWDVKIVGSDVSSAAVAKARRGVYSSLEVERGLTAERLRNFFQETSGGGWEVNAKLKSICTFEQRDLHKPLLGIGPFDVVFCRNVAIYFTEKDRQVLFDRIMRVMSRDGYLFVGSSESLSDLGMTPQRHCRSVFYRSPQLA